MAEMVVMAVEVDIVKLKINMHNQAMAEMAEMVVVLEVMVMALTAEEVVTAM